MLHKRDQTGETWHGFEEKGQKYGASNFSEMMADFFYLGRFSKNQSNLQNLLP